jgi:hypothetical protein
MRNQKIIMLIQRSKVSSQRDAGAHTALGAVFEVRLPAAS